MAVFRFALFKQILFAPLLIIFVSLLISLGLLYLGSSMGYEEFKSGYAVLSTDEDIDDRTLVSLLNKGHTQISYDTQTEFSNSVLTDADFPHAEIINIFGGKPVSESTQWVVLDNFESLEIIALDKYFSRVFPFDPRNDGYAEKLRDIFVKDGKRFVYIPLAAGNWNSAFLNKQIASLLKNIPHSVYYYGIGKPLLFFFIMYASASLCMLIFCLIRKKTHNDNLIIIALIPVFSSLAFFGASGIGCASLFFAIFVALKEPLGELLTNKKKFIMRKQGLLAAEESKLPVQTQKNKARASVIKNIIKDFIIPYKYYIFLLIAILVAVVVILIFSQLKPLFLFAVFASAVFVYLFSLIISVSNSAKNDNTRHRRFNPVLIIKRRFPDFSFSFYMLPFALAAFLTMFLSVYQSSSYIPENKFNITINEQDYYNHLEYQTSFSSRQFGSQNNIIPSFFFDTDGLLSLQETAPKQNTDFSDETLEMDKQDLLKQSLHKQGLHFPPFPLNHLIDFFHIVNSGQKTNSNYEQSGSLQEKLALLVLLLFVLAGFFIKRKDDYSLKVDFSGFRRMARKQGLQDSHGIGINRNKTLLYNDRTQNRSQTVTGYRKDA